MKKLILVFIASLTFSSSWAQSAPYAGFSVLSIPTLKPTLGTFVGFEFGNEHIKGAIGFNSSLIRFKENPDVVKLYEIATDEPFPMTFDTKMWYMSIPLMFKYYLMDTEETGSNVVFGMGVGMQFFSRRTIEDYDKSVYFLHENNDDAFDKSISANMIFIGQVGYQYTFESGLGVTAHIGYDFNVENILDYFEYENYQSSLYRPNIMTIGFGAKYTF